MHLLITINPPLKNKNSIGTIIFILLHVDNKLMYPENISKRPFMFIFIGM